MDKPKILIVEDDIDLSHMLCAFFRSQDYDVRAAVWGRDALAISREESLSLIMLDIRLPDMDGYEVYHQLRQNRHTQAVPIIFLSEKRHRVEILHGLELGVVDYIAKPFDVQELRLRVRNAILRASQPNLTNPVTNLPEMPLLEERFMEVTASKQPWSLLVVSIKGMDKLRELRGFVAADELFRAVALMVSSAIRDRGSDGDLVTHYRAEDLIILTTPDKVGRMRSLIDSRVRQSLMHLYRPVDADGSSESRYLNIETSIVERSREPDLDIDGLRARLTAIIGAPAVEIGDAAEGSR